MDAGHTSSSDSAALDPTTADTRELMRELLPSVRRAYVRCWEQLADAATPLTARRAARERVAALAEDHVVVAQALRTRERASAGDDALNLRHVADELERHASALRRLAAVSPHALQTTADLRPEALGCGKRYRDPARSGPATTRATPQPSAGRGRGGRDQRRSSTR